MVTNRRGKDMFGEPSLKFSVTLTAPNVVVVVAIRGHELDASADVVATGEPVDGSPFQGTPRTIRSHAFTFAVAIGVDTPTDWHRHASYQTRRGGGSVVVDVAATA